MMRVLKNWHDLALQSRAGGEEGGRKEGKKEEVAFMRAFENEEEGG